MLSSKVSRILCAIMTLCMSGCNSEPIAASSPEQQHLPMEVRSVISSALREIDSMPKPEDILQDEQSALREIMKRSSTCGSPLQPVCSGTMRSER